MAAASSTSGGSAGSVRAGRAFVELFTDDSKLKAGLNRAASTFTSWGKSLSAKGFGLLGIGGAAATAFGLMGKQAMDTAGQLADMGARLGVSVEELDALGYAAELAGSGLEEVEKAVGKMQNAIAEGKTVGGLNLGGMLNDDLPTQIDKVAEALATIENPIQRNAAASEIFGEKLGRKLVPYLSEGAAGMARFREEARLTGGLTSSEVDGLDRAGDAWTKLGRALKSVPLSIGTALFGDPEGMEAAANTIVRITSSVRDWIKENAGLVQAVAAVALGVTALGAAAVAAGGSFLFMSAAISAAGVVFNKMFLAKMFFFSGLGVVIAGIIVALREFTNLGEAAGRAWGGMGEALKSGNVELAFKIVFQGIKVEFLRTVKEMTEGWGQFMTVVGGAAGGARAGKMGGFWGMLGGGLIGGGAALTASEVANQEIAAMAAAAGKELDDLIAKANRGAAKAKQEFGKAGAALNASLLGGPTRGMFGNTSQLQQSLGVNDQTKTLEKIEKNGRDAVGELKKLKGAEWAP